VRELEDLIDFVNQHRVAIKTVMAGDLDLTTSAGRQVARHLGVAAQGESERQAERIRRQKQQAAEQGEGTEVVARSDGI
jgi:site-specific DNA recombinase